MPGAPPFDVTDLYALYRFLYLSIASKVTSGCMLLSGIYPTSSSSSLFGLSSAFRAYHHPRGYAPPNSGAETQLIIAGELGCYFSNSFRAKVPPHFTLIRFGPSPHTPTATMASADFLLFVVTISSGELLTSKIALGKSALFRLVPADFTNADSVWL